MSCNYWNVEKKCPKCNGQVILLTVMDGWEVYYCERCEKEVDT